MRLIRGVAAGVWGLAGVAVLGAQAVQTQVQWSQPAAELAAQIADILGPGQAQVVIHNLSTIQASAVPSIRKLLERDLKARGVLASGVESANSITLTLSENERERLWVAEVKEGSETHVTMVHVDVAAASVSTSDARMVLRSERIAGLFGRTDGIAPAVPILSAAEINGHFVVLYPEKISIFSSKAGAWIETNTVMTEGKFARDPRGILVSDADGATFTAYVPGAECVGSYSGALSSSITDSDWSVRCKASDDPWPVYQSGDASSATPLKAFYNSSRNFFTGVVTPGVGVDLQPFYTAGMISRAAGGAALLIAGIDSKVQLIENGTPRSIVGTRDWGSDFAVMRSGCGVGTQVITSTSGEAPKDSLRAFEIPALDALPVSGPLAMDGTVTALWTAQDAKSVLAVIRNPAGEYEVYRVTGLCN